MRKATHLGMERMIRGNQTGDRKTIRKLLLSSGKK